MICLALCSISPTPPVAYDSGGLYFIYPGLVFKGGDEVSRPLKVRYLTFSRDSYVKLLYVHHHGYLHSRIHFRLIVSSAGRNLLPRGLVIRITTYHSA